MNIMEVVAPWEGINKALGLSGPIRDEAHYEALLSFVEECFDRFGSDEHHPVFSLVDMLAERIEEYERKAHPWPQIAPRELLAQLMIEHHISQKDLPEIGPQSLVSAVLAGKRKLNLRQVKALAKRFSLPMETFAE
ncbi:MAG: transcriptional regulator [Betaproteobacteria bacterium]|nr:transcriptional regulator [Betaproteobacteria bacterium]